MKRKTIKLTMLCAMLMLSFGAFAQNPPHPNGGSGPGTGNTPVGGGAPLGGSLIILLSLGLGYGARKAYKYRQSINDQNQTL